MIDGFAVHFGWIIFLYYRWRIFENDVSKDNGKIGFHFSNNIIYLSLYYPSNKLRKKFQSKIYT